MFFQVGDRGMLLIFRPEATLRGDPLPAHGARGPGHFALGIAAGDLEAWRLRLSRAPGGGGARAVLAAWRPFPLLPGPGGQLRRADHAWRLGAAVGLVIEWDGHSEAVL